ncbi:MAG: Lactoylglutathione lyase [Ilumatobacteraceae bacterium]|nr:Lactoylglutathione lyase [Ilumatobacteraceae bacterium]
MSRVQLALNVADLDASIEFYTKLFRTPPAKIRDGYANFAIADPPLKLILFTGMGDPGSLNHVGVEVESTDEVAAVIARTAANGMQQEVQEQTSCCFAVQDKTWVKGPDNDWEFYTVLGDAPEMACAIAGPASGWSSDSPQAVVAEAAGTAGAGSASTCC